jgi:hypothetical protein
VGVLNNAGDDKRFCGSGMVPTYNTMLCDMENPPVPGAEPYDTDYQQYTSQDAPYVCDAVAQAGYWYGQGYSLISGNCLDAVYNILTGYGVDGMSNPSNVPVPNTLESGPFGPWALSFSAPGSGMWVFFYILTSRLVFSLPRDNAYVDLSGPTVCIHPEIYCTLSNFQ